MLDRGAKPYGLRTPLHCGVGVAVAPLPLGGRVRRGVVRDPARDEVVRAQGLGWQLFRGARLVRVRVRVRVRG